MRWLGCHRRKLSNQSDRGKRQLIIFSFYLHWTLSKNKNTTKYGFLDEHIFILGKNLFDSSKTKTIIKNGNVHWIAFEPNSWVCIVSHFQIWLVGWVDWFVKLFSFRKRVWFQQMIQTISLNWRTTYAAIGWTQYLFGKRVVNFFIQKESLHHRFVPYLLQVSQLFMFNFKRI